MITLAVAAALIAVTVISAARWLAARRRLQTQAGRYYLARRQATISQCEYLRRKRDLDDTFTQILDIDPKDQP